jgi:lipoprotein NlpI
MSGSDAVPTTKLAHWQREPVVRMSWLMRVSGWLGLGLIAALCGAAGLAAAGEIDVDELLNRAQAAELKGDRATALALADQAVSAAPTNPQCYYVRGRLYANDGQHIKALADFNKVLQLEPRAGQVYQFRGFERFRLGQLDAAIADFDKYLEFVPQQAAFHWQRGVACYLAGRYEAARRQFELHRLVNSNDVENAAWHFAAVARAEGLAAARAALFTPVHDRRVPMSQLYLLLQGKAKPDDVLQAARAGQPPAAELKFRLFLAHYYIGLYHEATGAAGLAREHILTAADQYAPATYIGDVARVHAQRYRATSP